MLHRIASVLGLVLILHIIQSDNRIRSNFITFIYGRRHRIVLVAWVSLLSQSPFLNRNLRISLTNPHWLSVSMGIFHFPIHNMSYSIFESFGLCVILTVNDSYSCSIERYVARNRFLVRFITINCRRALTILCIIILRNAYRISSSRAIFINIVDSHCVLIDPPYRIENNVLCRHREGTGSLTLCDLRIVRCPSIKGIPGFLQCALPSQNCHCIACRIGALRIRRCVTSCCPFTRIGHSISLSKYRFQCHITIGNSDRFNYSLTIQGPTAKAIPLTVVPLYCGSLLNGRIVHRCILLTDVMMGVSHIRSNSTGTPIINHLISRHRNLRTSVYNRTIAIAVIKARLRSRRGLIGVIVFCFRPVVTIHIRLDVKAENQLVTLPVPTVFLDYAIFITGIVKSSDCDLVTDDFHCYVFRNVDSSRCPLRFIVVSLRRNLFHHHALGHSAIITFNTIKDEELRKLVSHLRSIPHFHAGMGGILRNVGKDIIQLTGIARVHVIFIILRSCCLLARIELSMSPRFIIFVFLRDTQDISCIPSPPVIVLNLCIVTIIFLNIILAS